MSALHIGLCDGRHSIKQNDTLEFRFDTRRDNPTAGQPLDLFVFPAEVNDPLAFDEFRETAHDFIQGKIGGLEPGSPLLEGVKVYLYVTGLTPLLTSFLWVWIPNQDIWRSQRITGTSVPLVLMHYDRDTGQYKEEYWG